MWSFLFCPSGSQKYLAKGSKIDYSITLTRLSHLHYLKSIERELLRYFPETSDRISWRTDGQMLTNTMSPSDFIGCGKTQNDNIH